MSLDNITKQRKIAPHNQQQKQSEGRIGKVKTCTLLVMRKSNAPLIFWCYCLQFVVDYMNHSSVKSLDWKTPMEKLHETPPTFPCSASDSGPLCGTTNPQQNSRRITFSQRNTQASPLNTATTSTIRFGPFQTTSGKTEGAGKRHCHYATTHRHLSKN